MTGLLGGTFNPPHNGHLALARTAIDELELERLLVVVTGNPPHKQVSLSAETRFRLAQAAFEGMPNVELSRFEVDRPEPSYSVDTALWAEAEYGDVVLIVGADEFCDFLEWKEPNAILAHGRLAVATRPGYSRERLESVLARLAQPERVTFFELEPLPISSSDIRRRVARGEPIEELVPGSVVELIETLELYREE